MLYVTDTHSLVWFLSEDASLSKSAKNIFEKAEKGEAVIVVPTIVLGEFLYACQKKKVQDNFFRIIHAIGKSDNYASFDLTVEVVMECRNLFGLSELHDKMIVSTARMLKAPLITRDRQIIRSGVVEVI